jgi:hypothetical protein
MEHCTLPLLAKGQFGSGCSNRVPTVDIAELPHSFLVLVGHGIVPITSNLAGVLRVDDCDGGQLLPIVSALALKNTSRRLLLVTVRVGLCLA